MARVHIIWSLSKIRVWAFSYDGFDLEVLRPHLCRMRVEGPQRPTCKMPWNGASGCESVSCAKVHVRMGQLEENRPEVIRHDMTQDTLRGTPNMKLAAHS